MLTTPASVSHLPAPGQVVAQSARLQLRRFAPADAPGFFELNQDPLVVRFTGDRQFADLQAARDYIDAYDQYDLYGFGRWSIYLRETGEYAGFCGLKYLPEKDEVDVGFRLRRNLWGKGLATEAADLALGIGFGACGLTTIVGRAMKNNFASHSVLRKLNMNLTETFREEGKTWCRYQITREEYLGGVVLRDIEPADLPVLFKHQCDPEAVRMAAFTAPDPADEKAFNDRMTAILADPEIAKRAIVVDDKVVGNVMAFDLDDQRNVCYWIGRENWGRGYATRGLCAFLAEQTERPLVARVVHDNLGSIRVLEKCGFVEVGEETGFANGRGADVQEIIMELPTLGRLPG